MHRYYFIEGILALLGITLIATAIKYPKDVFIELPLGILKSIFRGIRRKLLIPLNILSIGDSEDKDGPYPSTKNLKVDFEDGEKYVCVLNSKKDLEFIINDYLEVLTGRYSIKNFIITGNGKQRIIKFPKGINFYDYHLFVQYLNSELGKGKSYGIYKSDNLQYFVFHDTETANNLIGFTSSKKFFSIYMLDDLKKNQYLKLNQKLKIKTDWITTHV